MSYEQLGKVYLQLIDHVNDCLDVTLKQFWPVKCKTDSLWSLVIRFYLSITIEVILSPIVFKSECSRTEEKSPFTSLKSLNTRFIHVCNKTHKIFTTNTIKLNYRFMISLRSCAKQNRGKGGDHNKYCENRVEHVCVFPIWIKINDTFLILPTQPAQKQEVMQQPLFVLQNTLETFLLEPVSAVWLQC